MTRQPVTSKLTPGAILRRCRAGAYLSKTISTKGAIFLLDGRRVKKHHAIAAIRSGKLVPRRDGFFGGDSQTWTASPSAGAEFPDLPDFLKRARSS